VSAVDGVRQNNARHVIAKERSDYGNLNTRGGRTAYFLKNPSGFAQGLIGMITYFWQ